MSDKKGIHWFAIRVSYGRVLKVCSMLREKGMECFVPMCTKTVEKNGKKETVTVPAVSNLGFVHATRAFLDEFFLSMGENRPAHFIWDKSTREPIVVPDKAMHDFMQISHIMADEALYLKDVTAKLQVGQKVRVLDGPFKGVEGIIMRVKRSRRVIVDFPGLLAIATTFIDPRDLELI